VSTEGEASRDVCGESNSQEVGVLKNGIKRAMLVELIEVVER